MRPTIAEIDLSAIAHNIQAIRKAHSASIMAVVKANGYGHGAVEVCKTALANGVKYLGVASAEEGILLRKAGISAPILVFSSAGLNDTDMYLRNDLEPTIFDGPGLQNLVKSARKMEQRPKVHVKIDTGMGRMGIHWQNALEYVKTVAAQPQVRIQSVYTHFATSDHLDKSYARLQLYRFNRVLQEIKDAGIDVPLVHAANSGAILDLPEAAFDMLRPGVLMYGYYPSGNTTESIPVKPAMTFKTRVLYIKDIEKGDSVSYDRLFIAERPTRVASLPVGYADGYNRLLSGQGEVLVRGKRFPVIGRVCMDMMMIDLGDDQSVQVGDEVVLFGAQENDRVTVESICEKVNTIPYEITCWVSERVPRIYINREEA